MYDKAFFINDFQPRHAFFVKLKASGLIFFAAGGGVKLLNALDFAPQEPVDRAVQTAVGDPQQRKNHIGTPDFPGGQTVTAKTFIRHKIQIVPQSADETPIAVLGFRHFFKHGRFELIGPCQIIVLQKRIKESPRHVPACQIVRQSRVKGLDQRGSSNMHRIKFVISLTAAEQLKCYAKKQQLIA